MKIARTENAARSILFGCFLKIYQILLPFLMRTAMIYFMGVQFLGLGSLFSSILQVLNLVELGVGNAMVYCMYKPIAEDDTDKICALMRLYRLYYRIIGAVIAVLGLLILPIIPRLIKGSVPEGIDVYVLYLLNLMLTVLSYWLFAYKNSILYAYQRLDISSKVTIFTNTVQYGLQFLVLCYLKNYYIFLLVAMASQIATNIITAAVVTKLYPKYKPVGRLDKNAVREINQRIRDLFTSKVGMVVINSADTIVISSFLGLEMLAIYQNYFYILNSIISIVSVVFNSCLAGIGNSLIVETKEKNYSDLRKFTFTISWLAGFCSACLLCLYQPFMKIWVGEELELGFSAVVCFCIYYYIYEINQLLNIYKDASGIWHEDRFRPLIAAMTNLVLNLIMVQFWGIYGVLLSTILSLIIVEIPWLLHNLFSLIFNRSQLYGYVKEILYYAFISFLICFITGFICSFIHWGDWIDLFLRGLICCVVPNLLFLCIYYKRQAFKDSVVLVDKMTKYKFRLAFYLIKE